jgi:hypothetical protein
MYHATLRTICSFWDEDGSVTSSGVMKILSQSEKITVFERDGNGNSRSEHLGYTHL